MPSVQRLDFEQERDLATFRLGLGSGAMRNKSSVEFTLMPAGDEPAAL